MEEMPGADDPTATLLQSQKQFYDLRAPDYMTGAPSDRRGTTPDRGIAERTRQRLVDELLPVGSVLELGCGPGGFTRELARHAQQLVALDASPQMLARNRHEVGASNVRYVETDVFSWEPPETFDVVFFGFFLSHVPPTLFERFWHVVGRALRPGGRVAFVDEDHRVAHYDAVRVVDGVPVASRKLTDGREFDIVKVFWEPNELATRLWDLGWDVEVRSVEASYLVGTGTQRAS